MRWHLWAQVTALTLALNYFAFQVELFEDEYEANHPKSSECGAFSLPTLTWESFDKDQAQQPFVIDALIQLELLYLLPPSGRPESFVHRPGQPIRDKSPPSIAVIS